MPPPSRRSRTWSTAIALVAVVLAMAVCGPHASMRHLTSGARTVVTDSGTGNLDATRTPELRQAASPHAAPQHFDLAAVPTAPFEPPVSYPTSPTIEPAASATPIDDSVPRGRAPPAV